MRPESRHSLGLPSIVCLLMAFLFGGCGRSERIVYSQFIDIPASGWGRDECCEYNTATVDSALFDGKGRYDIILAVRHTGECPYSELVLPVSQPDELPSLLPDTLKVKLAGRHGWRGSCSKGIYVFADTLLKGAIPAPLYSFRLYQDMPGESLPGLLSVGIIISKTENTN